jgi:hypothetical protein
MNTKPVQPRRSSPALRFRAQIETAEANGVAREDMTLRLTHGDASLLKRDHSLDVSDISFAGDVMRFLGVRVEVVAAESQLITPC